MIQFLIINFWRRNVFDILTDNDNSFSSSEPFSLYSCWSGLSRLNDWMEATRSSSKTIIYSFFFLQIITCNILFSWEIPWFYLHAFLHKSYSRHRILLEIDTKSKKWVPYIQVIAIIFVFEIFQQLPTEWFTKWRIRTPFEINIHLRAMDDHFAGSSQQTVNSKKPCRNIRLNRSLRSVSFSGPWAYS